jgi:hypothetical protein
VGDYRIGTEEESIMASDYIPHSYAAFRAWARNFLQTAEENKTEWGLPDAPLAALRAAYEDYEIIDDAASGAEATSSRRIRRKEAYVVIAGQFRAFVNKQVNPNDAIDEGAREKLGLRPRRRKRVPVGAPRDQVRADIRIAGPHLLDLFIVNMPTPGSEGGRSPCGTRIYYGVMPAGGASLEAAAGSRRELMAPPLSGGELPHSVFTRRRRRRFDFPEDDRGKTAYFCLRYENAKGDVGPWGPIVKEMVP